MRIDYIGHACFALTARDGTRVITDPYDASVGLAMLPLAADMITMSHGHHDHCCEDMLTGAPRIVRGTETAAAGSVSTRAVRSWHDDAQGAMRGENCIRIFDIDGLRVVHMGDQGCMPEADVLKAISGADVMMIPVGGFYTVDAQEARAIVELAKPRCVIPMHFLTAHGRYSAIAGHRPFLAAMGAEDALPVEGMEFDADSLPRGVLLMKPEADALA